MCPCCPSRDPLGAEGCDTFALRPLWQAPGGLPKGMRGGDTMLNYGVLFLDLTVQEKDKFIVVWI